MKAIRTKFGNVYFNETNYFVERVYTDLLDDGVTSPSDGDVVKGEIARNYNAGKRSHR